MKILVIGNDGRANAIVRRLILEGNDVTVIPGNSFLKSFGVKCDSLGYTDLEEGILASLCNKDKILDYCKEHKPKLIVATRVETSEAGVVDALLEKNYAVFGATQNGAELETSKEFGKVICENNGLPIPDWQVYNLKNPKELRKAINYVTEKNKPYVVKADGLAHGVGVTVCKNVKQTVTALMKLDGVGRVVIEERLYGMEVAFTALVCDDHIVPMFTNFEHKKQGNGDLGTMTAEMGTVLISKIGKRPMVQLFDRLRNFLAVTKYRGFLDINCIYDDETEQLKVLEFTCRFGDPITEIMIPMIKTNFTGLLKATAYGMLGEIPYVKYNSKFGVGVCVVSGGYPYTNACLQNEEIYDGYGNALTVPVIGKYYENIEVMSAKVEDNCFYTHGGRQFIVNGYAGDLETAIGEAYSYASVIDFQDKFYRTDIGERIISYQGRLMREDLI